MTAIATPKVSYEDFRRKWTTSYRCCFCHDMGIPAPAAVRAFSGVGVGGWPGCAHHAQRAITCAMNALLDGRTLSANYTVDVYLVSIDDEGYPKLGSLIFSARRKHAA